MIKTTITNLFKIDFNLLQKISFDIIVFEKDTAIAVHLLNKFNTSERIFLNNEAEINQGLNTNIQIPLYKFIPLSIDNTFEIYKNTKIEFVSNKEIKIINSRFVSNLKFIKKLV